MSCQVPFVPLTLAAVCTTTAVNGVTGYWVRARTSAVAADPQAPIQDENYIYTVLLPYVEVAEIGAATEGARASGAAVLLESREGPTGWRSVIATPAGGEIALWQPKR